MICLISPTPNLILTGLWLEKVTFKWQLTHNLCRCNGSQVLTCCVFITRCHEGESKQKKMNKRRTGLVVQLESGVEHEVESWERSITHQGGCQATVQTCRKQTHVKVLSTGDGTKVHAVLKGSKTSQTMDTGCEWYGTCVPFVWTLQWDAMVMTNIKKEVRASMVFALHVQLL